MAKTKKKRLMTSILDGSANYYLGGGDTNSYYTQQMITDNDGMRRMQFMPSESTMTNPFGQESAYNGAYKMNKLSYNDFDYQNMTPEAQQQFDAYNQQVKDNNKQYRQNQREARQEARQQEGGGFGLWGNVINGAANNMITAFTDPNMKVGDRVATILGMPDLAKNWRADTTKGDANITEMTNRINNATNRLIQDSNDTQGAFAAIKNNNNLNLIDTSGFKTPTLKDFKGKWWKNTGVAMAQGAASGSIGGPWGAAGGAVTGLLGSIGGLFGREGRAERALEKYKDDMSYLQRFAGNFNSFQRLNQQQSNENLLNNGLKQQRIQDLSNIRAYGGNLFDGGGSFDKDPLDEIPNGIWSTVNNSTNYVPTSDESTLTPAEQQKILEDWEEWKKEHPKLYLAGNITPFVGTLFSKYDYLSDPSFSNALSLAMSGTGDAALFMPAFVNRAYQGLKDWKVMNKLVRNPDRIAASFIGRIDDANDVDNYYNENIDIQPTYESSYIPRQREVVPEYEGYMLPEVVVEGNKKALGGNLFATGGLEDLPKLSQRVIEDDAFMPKGNFEKPVSTNPYLVDGLDWNNNWFDNRRDIFYKNAQLMGISPQQVQYINQDKPVDMQTNYKLDTIPSTRYNEFNNLTPQEQSNKILDSYLHNMSTVRFKKGDVEQDKSGSKVIGVYNPLIGNYDNTSFKHSIMLDTENMRPTSPTHEMYHAGNMNLLENAIAKMGINKPMSNAKPINHADYYDRPSEVLARRQEFLRENNISPMDVITEDYLNNPEIKKSLEKFKLDRYGNANLLKLFNEVADNNNSNQYDNVAAMGGQFDFNLSPNMIDLQNQSLANQKYKYNNQMQPVGFIDGGAGKIPNPGIPRLACGGKLRLNKFDFGGSMSMEDLPENMQSYGNGGTHEENPNGGIQVGVDQQGTPNLVEQGEFRYGDYVFSDRINVDPELLTEFNLAPLSKGKKKKNESYADAAKKMVKKAGDLNDPITKDTIDANMDRLKNAQEAQKFKEQQDQQLADYKSALKTPTQGNPMYGSMKYNGMGDVNQGLNEGVDSGMGAMDNSSLSNVNRSGNEMMAAYGGNLYANGSRLKRKDLQDIDLINRAVNIDDGLPTYNQNVYIPNAYGQGLNYAGTIPMTDYSSINPTRRLIAPEEDLQLVRQTSSYIPIENPVMRPLNFGISQSINTGTSDPSYTSTGKSFSYSTSSGNTVNKDVNYKDDPLTISKDATASGTTQNPQQSVNSLGDLQRLNAQYATGNPFDAPSYSTFGRHAAPLKFLPAAFADRMGLTNFDYDPNLRPNQELKAAGRTGFVPRTDDHSGMYRNAELFDINAANNAAQAQAQATSRAMGNVNDRNQAAANRLAADYNAMLGIGNNYQTMFDANMKSRFATDEYNKQTEQTNVAANNDMYRDNQNAGIQAKQMELNTLAQSMADQTQKELYADRTNREAHDNIAGTQTAIWNNTMQHFMDEAKRNDLYNKFNSDASQMWYYDKKLGKYVFKGDPAQDYLGTAMRTAKNPVTSLDADLLKQYNDYVAKVGSQNVSKEFIDNLVYQQGQRNEEKEAKSIADRNAQMQSDIDFMNTQFQDLDNLTINDKDKSYKFFDYINSPKQVEAVRNFLANADVSQMNPNDYKNYKALLDNWMRMRDRQLMYRNQISPYNVADATNTTWVGQDNQAYGGYINSSKKKKKQYYTDI